MVHRKIVPWGAKDEPPLVYEVPDGYEVAETRDRVPGGDTERGYRIRWFAQRVCDRMNAGRTMPTYRYEVVDTYLIGKRRYWPVAFQNVLVPADNHPIAKEGHDHAPR